MYRLRMLTLTTDIDALTRVGRAADHPIRRRPLPALRGAPAHPAGPTDALAISRTRLSDHSACLRDCGLVVAVPQGGRVRQEPADARPGHALDSLRSAVLAVEADRTCPDAAREGCC